MLNPIEMVWSQVKSCAKALLATKMPEILSISTGEEGTMTEQRLQALEFIIAESLNQLTPENIVNYISSIQRHFASVLNLEDMIF